MSFRGYCHECAAHAMVSGRVPICEACRNSDSRDRRSISVIERTLELPEGEDMIERSPEDLEADDV